MFSKLNRIRPVPTVCSGQIKKSILVSAIIGIILGFTDKILDLPIMPSAISNVGLIGSQWGVWIFISTLISVFSYTPILAVIRVIVFLFSMLFSYYAYTNIILGLFPLKHILFWCIIAILSIVPAYIIWFAHGNSLISKIITALPITVITIEGYIVYRSTMNYYAEYMQYGNILISKGPFWHMISTEIVYALLIVAILLIVPAKSKANLKP